MRANRTAVKFDGLLAPAWRAMQVALRAAFARRGSNRRPNAAALQYLRAGVVAIACASLPSIGAATQEAVAAVSKGSDPIRAERTALFDLVKFSGGFLAVGERGVVMRSSDGGRTWQGAQAPTTRTLVSIAVIDDKTLVAVGHGGAIVRSEDAGRTWTAIDVPDTGGDSILGVTLLKDGRLFAYGAYGMFLVSEDQGKNWERRSVISEEFDRHISRIVEAGDSLYLIGESGTIARSDDGGEHWARIESPYEGSFFGLLALGHQDLVAFGMRGNVFRTHDGGATWTQIPLESKSALNGGYVTADGRVVIAGNNGLVAVSDGAVSHFDLQVVPEGTPVAKAMYADDGELVYVGYLASGRLPAAGASADPKQRVE